MTPRAMYRLQFNKEFGFQSAARIAPYLAHLGVSHVYASPWLKAQPGSPHGYDIVDYRQLNPELGTRRDFDEMTSAFHANGLGQILDFVPNHMGVGGSENDLWLDVLEWGPESIHAGWFDIEWRSEHGYLRDKLLVPFLGDQYGVELYQGKLRLKFDREAGTFAVWAYDQHKLPICPLHYGRILGDAHPELERLSDSFSSLEDWKPQVARRALELKAELAALVRDREDIHHELATVITRYVGTPGQPDTWLPLDALIKDQYWRAADYRVAADDINYRRFFNVNGLAGIRMELPEVFEHAHELVFRLIAEGAVDGLRIDHVDGLLNPKAYLSLLRNNNSLYLVVEKILARHESLRNDWPVDGTTGYEFTSQVLGLLIDPEGEPALTQTYMEWTGERTSFRQIARDSKRRIMSNEMASELDVLAGQAARVARQTPSTADFTQNVLHRALREVLACFPVYRTYVDEDHLASKEDRVALEWAVKHARANEIDLDSTVFDFIFSLLSGDLLGEGRSGFSRHSVLRCAMKLQQFSCAVMAKGMEDTAFYRYNRFTALNEVGGDPDQFNVTLAGFHRANSLRAKHWPHSMLTTSTHDTKRGEDTRARLAVLSEIPRDWASHVETWSRILRARRGEIGNAAPPDRNDEYLLYQLILGSWPADLTQPLDKQRLAPYTQRLKEAMTKSLREAKVHSTWRSPNQAYESAVLSFIDDAFDLEKSEAFLASFLPYVQRIARLGVENSLVQVALKLTSPGVPDVYQGAELWDLSMVDPDNRRPVDFEQRSKLLGESSSVRHLLENWRDGAIKLFVTQKLLALRSTHADLFSDGCYEPIAASGAKADFICAFERRNNRRSIIVLTARYPAKRESDSTWLDTEIPLPSTRYRDVLTGAEFNGETISAVDAFRELPVAVLVFEDPQLVENVHITGENEDRPIAQNH